MNIKFFAKALVAAALTALALAACKKDPKNPDDNIDPQPIATKGLSVKATYFGDYYGKGFHDYILLFQLGEIGEDGYFKTSGVELSLDVLTATGGPTLFPAGTYEITDDKYNSAGIIPSIEGEDNEGNVTYGDTYLYTQQDADNYWLEPLQTAHLEVEMNGAQYTISVKVKVDGEEYSYLYIGALPIVDERENEDPGTGEGPDGDYNFKPDQAYASNLGRSWTLETDDWEFEFDNSKNPDEWMSVEIVSAAASDITAIPTGTFSIPADFYDDEYEPVSGNLLPPYIWDNAYCGTFYGYGEEVWYIADSGNLKISKSGENYTFELSFKDNGDEELGYSPAKVTMTYTGKVEVDVSNWWDGVEDEDEGSMLYVRKAAPSAKVKFGRKHTTHKSHFKAASKFAGRL